MVGAGDMVGTIMDLARRGFLTIEEVKHEDRGFLDKLGGTPEYDYVLKMVHNKQLRELTAYEGDLIRFIFSRRVRRLAADTISLYEFKKEAQKTLDGVPPLVRVVEEDGEATRPRAARRLREVGHDHDGDRRDQSAPA